MSVPARRGRYIYRRKSHLAKSSKVSRESIVADAPPEPRAPPDKSGSMPEDDDAWHKHSRDKRGEKEERVAFTTGELVTLLDMQIKTLFWN